MFQQLEERQWSKVGAHGGESKRAFLYGTTYEFLEYFCLNSIYDLLCIRRSKGGSFNYDVISEILGLIKIVRLDTMTIDELNKLVAQGESSNLEFKETTNSRAITEAGKTICGFLNANGGTLLFGITNKGKVIGQQVTDATRRELSENLVKHFYPHAHLKIDYICVTNNKQVIAITVVTEALDPPYYFKNIAYHRSGPITQIMDPSLQESMIETKSLSKRWEDLPALGCSIEDLDSDEIYRTVTDGIRYGRIPPGTDSNNKKDILAKLKLIKDGHLINAAMVLYAKDPFSKYSQCTLRMARFRGKDKEEFIDNQQTNVNAFEMVKLIDNFCARHLPIAGKIVEYQMQRIDEPFLPPLAIREAIINSICHRSYSSYTSAINFAIYDNRIEIISFGKLPKGIKLKDLKHNHGSFLRNPKIASVFHRRGMIEQWGRGTQQIVKLCLQAGHPEPEFIEMDSSFMTCMYSKHPMTTYIQMGNIDEKEITKRQQTILNLLKKYEQGLTLAQMLKEVDTSERTLRRELKLLVDQSYICSQGGGKYKRWFIN